MLRATAWLLAVSIFLGGCCCRRTCAPKRYEAYEVRRFAPIDGGGGGGALFKKQKLSIEELKAEFKRHLNLLNLLANLRIHAPDWLDDDCPTFPGQSAESLLNAIWAELEKDLAKGKDNDPATVRTITADELEELMGALLWYWDDQELTNNGTLNQDSGHVPHPTNSNVNYQLPIIPMDSSSCEAINDARRHAVVGAGANPNNWNWRACIDRLNHGH